MSNDGATPEMELKAVENMKWEVDSRMEEEKRKRCELMVDAQKAEIRRLNDHIAYIEEKLDRTRKQLELITMVARMD